MSFKPEHIQNISGKDFVKYEGLLDEAHRQGLCRTSTTLIQIPHVDNGGTAIVIAEVETSKGVFCGIGDASPQNVGRMIAPHVIRMAETRAKARAMRDATNIGMTSLEELDDTAAHDDLPRQRDTDPVPLNRAIEPDRPPAASNGHITKGQSETIVRLNRQLGYTDEPPPPDTMTSTEAAAKIAELSKEFNRSRGRT